MAKNKKLFAQLRYTVPSKNVQDKRKIPRSRYRYNNTALLLLMIWAFSLCPRTFIPHFIMLNGFHFTVVMNH
jgi:hypothetical protein